LYALEFTWQRADDGGVSTVHWIPDLEFFDEDKVIIVTVVGLNSTIFSYSTSGLSVGADTPLVDRGWFTSDAAGRYVKLRMKLDLGILLVGDIHPSLFFDNMRLSRALAKLTLPLNAGTGGDRSHPKTTWLAPLLVRGALIDNAQGYTNGTVLPFVTEHTYTVKFDGEYNLFGRIVWVDMKNDSTMMARILKNGTPLIVGDRTPFKGSSADALPRATVTVTDIFLATGDVLKLQGFHDGGTETIDDSESELAVSQVTNKAT
jgi:hypothetical protein